MSVTTKQTSSNALSFLVFTWFGIGFVSLIVVFGIDLALNKSLEILVGVISVSIGLVAGGSDFWVASVRRSGLSLFRRVALFMGAPLVLAAISWSNIYAVLFAVHGLFGQYSLVTLTVSSKGEASPHRQVWSSCKHYIRFYELSWYPGGKQCVPREVWDKVRRGDRLSAFVSRSLIGDSVERVDFFMQARESLQNIPAGTASTTLKP